MTLSHGRLAVVLLAFTGCGDSESSSSSRPPVIHVKETDKEMNAAMEKARATLDTFFTAQAKPGPKQKGFSIKAPFEEGGKVEHMWVNEVRAEGDLIKGKIGNDPENLKRFHAGMACSFPRSRVSDWMYIDDGRLVGGTSIRLLRNRMSAAERKDFDRSIPFKID
jgi:uncharacterized protein YegJ (DUF2314 family)